MTTRQSAPVRHIAAKLGEMLPLNVVGAQFFVGIDCASQMRAVRVQDANGRRVAAFTVEHTAAGLAGLMRRLARRADPAAMPVGIERPDGRLVDALLEAGHPVVPVKPTRSRPGATGKSCPAPSPTTATTALVEHYGGWRSEQLQAAILASGEQPDLVDVERFCAQARRMFRAMVRAESQSS
jgi:hypothetical protein